MRFVVQPPLARRCSPEVREREDREHPVARGLEDLARLGEQLSRGRQVALVRLDFTDVVRHLRGTDDVTDPLTERLAALVEVERLLPTPLVVGVDTHVVEHVRLPE